MRKLALLIPLLVSACAANEPRGGAAMPLVNALGAPIGTVRAWQTTGGVTFRIEAQGLPHGVHGLHVHAVGRCDPPEFTSAGAHWNPAGKQHGMNNPAGPHAGDLPNVDVAANGVLGATVTLAGASLTAPPGTAGALLDADGAALVLHAKADDYATDQSGNSGARIACAVIRPTPQIVY
ncbi:MAG TPA: superoxide dismutase family protein [Sphingomicrobium sp.]|jgi:Cu-Zn family superoxide dismutase|nr:superoxide dismutase family protein [Sphingomicrobium sp.]